MRSMAEVFAKIMFWAENCIYMCLFVVYEMFLVPIIYFRVFVNITRLANFRTLVRIIPFYLIFGMLALVFFAIQDIFHFIRILCDYQEDEDYEKAYENKKFNVGKILIFNELIEVMTNIKDISQIKNKDPDGFNRILAANQKEKEMFVDQAKQKLDDDDMIE
jgi:hypothetical protein